MQYQGKPDILYNRQLEVIENVIDDVFCIACVKRS